MLVRLKAPSSLLALCLAIASGCGGSQTAEPASPADAEGGGEATAPSKAFDDMGPGEKLKYMKEVIQPQMAKTFQAYDGEHYGDFGCPTCHGPGAKDGDFRMPTESLPKLPEDMTALSTEKPEVMKFMAEKVKPEMGKLLGDSEFGCFDCHTKE